jgi:hypothetical protein
MDTPTRAGPGARDQRIDFWRGLCIVGMVSWHILTHPSRPRVLAFVVIQGFNFVAEGFVFLAGTSIGLVAARPGVAARDLDGRCLRRALRLLLVHYAVATALALPALIARPDARRLIRSLAGIATLEYQPYLGDVLSVFVFLFALTPPLLAARRALGGAGLLGLSGGVYLATVLWPAFAPRRWPGAPELNHHGAFDVNSWQLVYVLGVLFGGRYATIVRAARGHIRRSFGIALAAFVLIAGFRLGAEPGGSWAGRLPDWLRFGRHPLGPARLAYVALQIILIGLATIRSWDRLGDRVVVRIVIAFGRNSLGLFVASIFLDYLFKAAMDRLGWGPPLNVALWAAELGILYALALWSGRPAAPPPAGASGPAPGRRRRRASDAGPGAPGVASGE